MTKDLNIADLINNGGCFDLQFRKDVRHERLNSPTYYRWKIQFVITNPKENSSLLEAAKQQFDCGEISVSGGQARYSVQKIEDINNKVIPLLKKNKLTGKKSKDFELWRRASEIIFKNKGKNLASWKKNDLHSLIEIQKSSTKYKKGPKQPKWIEIARSFAKTN
ncbi:MAG: LAGLIDADG family homing endonuclease [Candidatus Staskawiczbacteria bacterium]|nr:LAGLIDADG family homing endonuclease [Candidatus Staskawiczbacteria bacterium]